MIMYRHTQQIFLKTIVRCHMKIETSLACCNQSSCSYWPDQDHFPMHLQCKWWKNRIHSPRCVLKYIPKLGKGNTKREFCLTLECVIAQEIPPPPITYIGNRFVRDLLVARMNMINDCTMKNYRKILVLVKYWKSHQWHAWQDKFFPNLNHTLTTCGTQNMNPGLQCTSAIHPVHLLTSWEQYRNVGIPSLKKCC